MFSSYFLRFGVRSYVIESRLNDLIYIVNTPTRRKKSQICQVTTHVFSKDYKLMHCVNNCDGFVISKHHEWMKCTSKCFKDKNKASLFFQLWIIEEILCIYNEHEKLLCSL
jgi:hypothetical protein